MTKYATVLLLGFYSSLGLACPVLSGHFAACVVQEKPGIDSGLRETTISQTQAEPITYSFAVTATNGQQSTSLITADGQVTSNIQKGPQGDVLAKLSASCVDDTLAVTQEMIVMGMDVHTRQVFRKNEAGALDFSIFLEDKLMANIICQPQK